MGAGDEPAPSLSSTVMTSHPLTPLLSPRSIAFVGASARPNTPGHDMMRMVRRGGFVGAVHAVNPNYREIEGYACVPSLADLPDAPYLVVLSVRNERLEETMREAIARGAKASVLFASAFLDNDSTPPLAARLAALARDGAMPVCGANCMGFYNDLDRVWICGFPSPREPRPGGIAFIAHSGSVFGALAHNDPRLRFAMAISPGQELTTTVADYIDYAVDRPEVKVVGLFIETAREPKDFRRALDKAARRGVPVVALKVGRTEAAAAAALTHTGAMAGSDLAYEALFDCYGVIRVETIDELATTLMLLATGRRAAKGGLVSIHDSGGEREMIIDLADRANLRFAAISDATKARIAAQLDPGLEAANPLDAWGTGADFVPKFTAGFQALVDDDNAALGLFCADIRDQYYLSDGFGEAALAVAQRTTKPVALVTNYTQLRHDQLALKLAEAGVPVLDGTFNALVAARGALAYRDFCARPADAPPPAARTSTHAIPPPGSAALDEAASLALLNAWDIPVAAHAVADSEDAAASAARGIGYPLVLKTAMPGILHKSDVGGVRLGLQDENTVRAAYRDMAARLGPRALLARMVPKGVELALGMVDDQQFGPLVTVGAGGVLIELLSDRRAALAPFGPLTARRLLDGLAVRRLLDGYRGGAKVDIDRLCAIVASFSVMAAELSGSVAEIDINPLVCGAEIVAVDALIVPRK
jgi:acyl-CoA synthetase (NDP forming)